MFADTGRVFEQDFDSQIRSPTDLPLPQHLPLVLRVVTGCVAKVAAAMEALEPLEAGGGNAVVCYYNYNSTSWLYRQIMIIECWS